MRFAEAADGVCRLLWVVPPGARSEDRATMRFARGFGEVVDVSDVTPAEAAARLRDLEPAGIACLIDAHLVWTAEIAELLRLPFHSRSTALRLTDKLAQRTALRNSGLVTPSFWDVDDLADRGILDEIVANGFPLVLKPRRGTSSADTERVTSLEQLTAASAASVPGRMLLEGFIPDPTTPSTGAGSAPYASVELLVSRGKVTALGVTGRTPLAEPFRETGFLFPADLSEELAERLVEVAITATRAMGVETGALHVELKCTDDGPVVIEVNGRPGGHAVHPLLRRALGIDTVQLAMRVAVGDDVVIGDLPASTGVSFRFDVQPEAWVHTITAVEGFDAVLGIRGVEQVVQGLVAGDEFSWRSGTLGYAAAVLGTAADHEEARRIRDLVLTTIVISGTP